MDKEEFLLYYKIFRIALLVVALYGIIAYLWFTRRGKQLEQVAERILEDD